MDCLNMFKLSILSYRTYYHKKSHPKMSRAITECGLTEQDTLAYFLCRLILSCLWVFMRQSFFL